MNFVIALRVPPWLAQRSLRKHVSGAACKSKPFAQIRSTGTVAHSFRSFPRRARKEHRFPFWKRQKAFVLFLCGKKKNEKEAASVSLDHLCKKEPRRVRLPHVFLSYGQEIRRSTPQREVRAAGHLVPCGMKCRRKDQYGVWP